MDLATKAFIADSFSAMLVNASFSVQKLGHREVETKAGDGARGHCCSPRWWIGFTLMVIGVVIHLIALPYADLTLLAANSTFAILINLILSIVLFGERFVCKYDFTAMLFIIGGCALIVFSSNKQQAEYNGQALLDILKTTRAICFYITIAVTFIVTNWAMVVFERALRRFEDDAELEDHKNRASDSAQLILQPMAKDADEGDTDIEAESSSALAKEEQRPLRVLIDVLSALPEQRLAQVSERSQRLKYWLKAPMVLLIFLASIVCGMQALLLKIVDTMIQMGDLETHWAIFLLLGLAILFTADTQLQYLNLAIKLYDQLEVIPVYQTLILLVWIYVGLVLFKEHEFYSTLQIVGVLAGAVFSLIGVKFLTMKTKEGLNTDLSAKSE